MMYLINLLNGQVLLLKNMELVQGALDLILSQKDQCFIFGIIWAELKIMVVIEIMVVVTIINQKKQEDFNKLRLVVVKMEKTVKTVKTEMEEMEEMKEMEDKITTDNLIDNLIKRSHSLI